MRQSMHPECIKVHPRIHAHFESCTAVRLCQWILKSDTCEVEQSTKAQHDRMS